MTNDAGAVMGLRLGMKVRFSLRVVLSAIAILSALLCIFVVRPTMLANRFVAAVVAQDMDAVDAFLSDKNWREEAHSGLPREVASRTDHTSMRIYFRATGVTG